MDKNAKLKIVMGKEKFLKYSLLKITLSRWTNKLIAAITEGWRKYYYQNAD